MRNCIFSTGQSFFFPLRIYNQYIHRNLRFEQPEIFCYNFNASGSGELGSGDSNPHWFHIAIFPVTAVNPLKIRQYSLRNLLCYRKNCLCETASTCSAEFLQRISVRKGAGGLTPVKTDKAEGFVKIQSTGNAGSSPHCLSKYSPYEAADAREYIYAEKREQKPLCAPKNF